MENNKILVGKQSYLDLARCCPKRRPEEKTSIFYSGVYDSFCFVCFSEGPASSNVQWIFQKPYFSAPTRDLQSGIWTWGQYKKTLFNCTPLCWGIRPLSWADVPCILLISFWKSLEGLRDQPANQDLIGCYVEVRSFNPEGLSALNIPIGFEAVN